MFTNADDLSQEKYIFFPNLCKKFPNQKTNIFFWLSERSINGPNINAIIFTKFILHPTNLVDGKFESRLRISPILQFAPQISPVKRPRHVSQKSEKRAAVVQLAFKIDLPKTIFKLLNVIANQE